jgi:hypothetical protein
LHSGKRLIIQLALVSVLLAGACGRAALLPSSGSGGESDSAGGSGGSGGSTGSAGAGGTVFIRLPDGGLSALLGDSGILGGILDAPRDSLMGQIICGPEARFGASCSGEIPGCLLPSLGGACACVSGTYICPSDTTQGPTACPKGAATGGRCTSLFSVCLGGGANACICAGTYTCF